MAVGRLGGAQDAGYSFRESGQAVPVEEVATQGNFSSRENALSNSTKESSSEKAEERLCSVVSKLWYMGRSLGPLLR